MGNTAERITTNRLSDSAIEVADNNNIESVEEAMDGTARAQIYRGRKGNEFRTGF